MEISTDPVLIRAYRTGDHALLSGAVSPLGDMCSQCGKRVTSGGVLANDALGWQIAHGSCVGVQETEVIVKAEPVNIDYAKGKAPLRQALVAELQAQDQAVGVPGHTLRAIARAAIDNAREGDLAAIKDIADRLDGKPAQEMQLPPGSELGVSFVIRGPAPMSREEWIAAYGASGKREGLTIEHNNDPPLPPSESA